jgi:hypothetical protein
VSICLFNRPGKIIFIYSCMSNFHLETTFHLDEYSVLLFIYHMALVHLIFLCALLSCIYVHKLSVCMSKN